MSVVSGVTVFCSVADELAENDQFVAGCLNELARTFGAEAHFVELSEKYGGPKHPQQLAFGAGLNHFSNHENDFAHSVFQLKWSMPEHVVVVIKPENGRTKVFLDAGERT